MNQSQRVLAAGTGLSGISAARLILERDSEVVLYDGNTALRKEDVKTKLSKETKVSIVLGEIKRFDPLGVELCIISPGVPLDSPFVAIVDDVKIPILGEIELAYQCVMDKLTIITGTNGETTTTALTGEMLKARYEETFAVESIGDLYTARVLDMTEESVAVTEISSFQLRTIMDFYSDVNAVSNITPGHPNHHGTMENYTRIKECITLSQTEQDVVVLNYDDPVLRRFGQDPKLKPRVIWFSSREKLADGFCMNEDNIVHYQKGHETVLVNARDMKLLGRHNYKNVMAVAATDLEVGVSMVDITKVMEGFLSAERRVEFMRERTGIRYYNDSKGTNPGAAIQTLRAMPGPTILIASRYDKSSDYGGQVPEFEDKARYIVLTRQIRGRITKYAKEHKFTEVMYAEDMQEAIQVCAVYTDTGDYVLFNPACASQGMLKNYEEHGHVFKKCVMALQRVDVYDGKGAGDRPTLGLDQAADYEPRHKRAADIKEKKEGQTFL